MHRPETLDLARAEPTGLQIEHHSIDYIPESERHAKLASQGPFWFLGNFHFFTISIGFVGPGMGLSAGWTTLAGALGIMFGTLFMAFHGSQGPEMGLPQMIQSRAQFGYRGVIVALLATLFVFVGFNVVNVSLMVDGVHNVFGIDGGFVAVAAVAIGALLAIYGHDLMHRTFTWALVATLPLYALVTLALVFGHAAPSSAPVSSTPSGFNWIGFATQFAIAASYNISYAPYVSDYSRYLPKQTSRAKLIAVIFAGASLSGAWMIGLGAWLAQKLHAADALVAMNDVGASLVPGLGKLIAFVSLAGFLPIIALNAYSAMLTVLTGIDSIVPIKPTRRARVASILAISTFVLACVFAIRGNGIALLQTFLTLMLYFLVPWTAVNLVDYFFVRRGHYAIAHFFTPSGLYGAWQLRGILSYLIGFASMVPFFYVFDAEVNREVFVGPFARMLGGVDVAWLVGLIVSGGVYWLMSRSLDLDRERRIIAETPAVDVPSN
ncbi:MULTISPECIES: purine-cytosine permease family protein [Burkholderia]|jgi:nucleobase:cation symporter-1, NCS1 family|uniref:Cytosine permease n=13 Tax=Burkholderia cenocepacia TaxID=95486 RepID=A0A9Q5MKQ2_9BURK|nr:MULTISPECIES: cytosine permease [Burkholderia]ALV58574.1 allantoin permease [Burkholderia cenocepacia]AMU08976.1 allantoin permease [Burkholderia cenocepacia]AMU12269.1 allantoin permease [Burkholderia cenocepacia]AQQ22226.1 allantoin permease [Burkholderia cenocepacia]AQQ45358.1 allantoin permease [Burkholderia cenocepacia]